MALPSGYRPQLDSLRAIAVAMVALHHWEAFRIGGRELQLGFLGVALFFVLSGYLITGILLGVDRRRRQAPEPVGIVKPIVAFYLRRFLRLFPAYYFFLFVTWVTGVLTWENGLGWYLAYAANIRIMREGWDVAVPHLWSLAVEEQFYLLAPIAVLGLKRRSLVALMVGTVAVGLYSLPMAAVVPPGAFVGLLVGCLLAVGADSDRRWPDRLGRVWPIVFAVWIAVYALSDESRPSYAAFRLLAFIALAGLIWKAANGYRGPIARVLEWGPVLWLGRLSYGFYLWHLVAKNVIVYAGFDYEAAPMAIRLAVVSAATTAVVALSWRIVERPFLDLKDRFPYLPPSVNSPSAEREADYASSP